MLTRKLVPILVILMLSMMIAPGIASATTNTTKSTDTEPPIIIPVNQTPPYLKVYDYSYGELTDNLRAPAIDEITIHKNKRCIAAVKLFNNYHRSLVLRVIRYELSNSNETIIKTGHKSTFKYIIITITSFIDFTVINPAIFDLGKLSVGEYTLKVFYKGNKKEKLAPCEKYVKIHVIP